MLEARPSKAAMAVFRLYVRRLFKKQFHSLRLFGQCPATDAQLPLMLLPNHSTWWDGFFAFFLNDVFFRRPFYLMMLEDQLAKYPFFRRLGAFGIDPSNPRAVLRSLRYTAGLLNTRPSPLICLFPQGELLPWGQRPLGYRNGIEWIAGRRQDEMQFLPLAIRCEFRGEQRPEVFFQFGANRCLCGEAFPGAAWLEEQETQLLQQIEQQLAANVSGELLLHGRASVSRTIDRFRGR